jgi:hypothetical protein
MKSYAMHFLIVFGLSLAALTGFWAFFEPTGGPLLPKKTGPPPDRPVRKVDEIENYVHAHYDEKHTLVWSIRGGKARRLGEKKLRLSDTELVLFQYRGEGEPTRRVTLRAPSAVGEFEGEDKGYLLLSNEVSVETSDGLHLSAAALRCEFRKTKATGKGDDPFRGWDWTLHTDEEVTVDGPGLSLRGRGLRGQRQDMTLTILSDPRACIGRGLGEIAEFGRMHRATGEIRITARGPLVLTAPGALEGEEGSPLRIHVEEDVLLCDFSPLSPDGLGLESILGCRVLDVELRTTARKEKDDEARVTLCSVRGEGDVRYVNLGPDRIVEAAFRGRAVSFRPAGEGRTTTFRIEGMPRAVFLSSASFTSGLADTPTLPISTAKEGPCTLLWIASDTELRVEALGAERGPKPGAVSVTIPQGATLATYVREPGRPAATGPLGLDRDLQDLKPAHLPVVEVLREGFVPELVLTSHRMDVRLGRTPGRNGTRAKFMVERFSAKGDVFLRDFGAKGRMESFCSAASVTYGEDALPQAAGGGFRREIRLSGLPRMGFTRGAMITPWAGQTLSAPRRDDLPDLYLLSCTADIYVITFFSGLGPKARPVRQLLNLEGKTRFQAFSGTKGGDRFFGPELRPDPSYARHLSIRAGSAEFGFLPSALPADKGRLVLGSVRADGGFESAAFDGKGRTLRSAGGESLDWKTTENPDRSVTESAILSGGNPRMGFATVRHLFPFRPRGAPSADWLLVETKGKIHFTRRLVAGDGMWRSTGADLHMPRDVVATMTPLSQKGRRVEWKLVCDDLRLRIMPAAGGKPDESWIPAGFTATGSVGIYNYNADGSAEAWGSASRLTWTREDTESTPRDWTLTLWGHPMILFGAKGRFLAHGKDLGAAARTHEDAWVKVEARDTLSLTAESAATPSEILTITARREGIFTASGVLKGATEKTLLQMSAESIRCHVTTPLSLAPGATTEKRAVREVVGSGETTITEYRPDGSMGIYRGSDLRLRPLAAEGEKRVWGPGKWTFELR